MSVLVEGFSLIVRRSTIESAFPGGISEYERLAPTNTFCADQYLTRVGFSDWPEVTAFLERLRGVGLTHHHGDDDGPDVGVVHQDDGFLALAPWLEWGRDEAGHSIAWLSGTDAGQLSVPGTQSIVELLKLLRMGASEAETQAAFRGWAPLPSHPTKRAIGFLGEASGRPVAVICYFAETTLVKRLARAVVNLFPERPPDAEAEALYTTVKQALLSTYGGPKADDDLSGERDAPEFRLSRMTTWIAGDTVVTLGLALKKHGVPPSLPALALSVADKTHEK